MAYNHSKLIPFTYEYWKNQYKDYLNPAFKSKSLLLPARLEFKPISLKDFNNIPTVIAIDTETFASNGNLICICNSENQDVLYGSSERQPTILDYFDYFYKLQNHKRNVCFFAYNLKFDASIILKSLKMNIEDFYEEEFELTHMGVKIKYLNKKCLSLSKGKTTINIYDALQYFIGAGIGGSSSLDNVSKAYLGDQKKYE